MILKNDLDKIKSYLTLFTKNIKDLDDIDSIKDDTLIEVFDVKDNKNKKASFTKLIDICKQDLSSTFLSTVDGNISTNYYDDDFNIVSKKDAKIIGLINEVNTNEDNILPLYIGTIYKVKDKRIPSMILTNAITLPMLSLLAGGNEDMSEYVNVELWYDGLHKRNNSNSFLYHVGDTFSVLNNGNEDITFECVSRGSVDSSKVYGMFIDKKDTTHLYSVENDPNKVFATDGSIVDISNLIKTIKLENDNVEKEGVNITYTTVDKTENTLNIKNVNSDKTSTLEYGVVKKADWDELIRSVSYNDNQVEKSFDITFHTNKNDDETNTIVKIPDVTTLNNLHNYGLVSKNDWVSLTNSVKAKVSQQGTDQIVVKTNTSNQTNVSIIAGQVKIDNAEGKTMILNPNSTTLQDIIYIQHNNKTYKLNVDKMIELGILTANN